MSSENETSALKTPARRKFFRTLVGAGSGAVAAAVGLKILPSGTAEAAPIPPPLAESSGSVILRMQQDLDATLASGKTPSWLMVVDTRKCIGCDACTVACRAENPTGPAGNFRRVIKKDLPTGPQPWAIYKPANCLQCDDPPCARAVPQGMIAKRPDGIVEFDLDKLKGAVAGVAARACPFGAIHVDDGKTFTAGTPRAEAYEQRSFVENGKTLSRKPGANPLQDVARKCTFCSHLLDVGVLPACVTTCVGGAMYFGDGNNPTSLITQVTQGRRVFRGHQNLGVKPRVIYFEESMPDTPHIACGACHF